MMFTSSEQFEEWLVSRFWPLMGAEDDNDDDSSSDDDDNSDDDSDDSSSDDDSNDDDNSDGSAAEVERVKLELEKKDKELRAAQKAIANAKKEAREAKAKVAKENGNWESVAQETRAELDDVNDKLQKAEERADTAEASLDKFQRQVRVTSIASRLGFRDPADAIALLKSEETGDDKTAERALRTLARDKSYLVDERKASGRSMNGGGGNNGLYSKEELDKMTPAEIQANREKVHASLAAMGPGGNN